MPDTANPADVEDVLSSIRRLVAEGDRSRTGARARPSAPHPAGFHPAHEPTGPGPAGGQTAPERFVLTPALRVAAGDAGAADRPVADRPAADEAPFIDTDDLPAEPEGTAEPMPFTPRPGFGGPSRPATGASADAPFAIHAAPTAASRTEAGEPGGRDLSSLEATIAELEAAVTQQPDEWEPDGSEDSPVLGWHSAPAPIPGPTAAPTTLASLRPGVLQPFPGLRAGSRLSLVATEDAPLFQHRPSAPQRPGGDAVAPAGATPAPPFDAASDADETAGLAATEGPALASGPALPEGPGAPAASREAPAAADDDLAWPGSDEAALRALIAEVVREELRGPLGQGVTRNIRKMVRREIYRVLATQNLD